MKIVMITPGRFHHFDLASYLESQGVLERIFTGYPKIKLANEQVSSERITSFWLLHTVYMALSRFGRSATSDRILAAYYELVRFHLDRRILKQLPPCDGLVALSGSGFVCGRAVQDRGGFYVCDRGSTHILHQDETLRTEMRVLGLPEQPIAATTLRKELSEYAVADAIFVPSDFVRNTFLARGIPPERVHVVPYGVDIRSFRPGPPKSDRFSVLFAGQVVARKGIHYLLRAWAEWATGDAELRIAGVVSGQFDALARWAGGMPRNVVMLGHLNRAQLAAEMSRAHALVLPSLEEGLALVMMQALACGTPVIATVNTGAETLFTSGIEGLIGPARSVAFLKEAFERLAADRALAGHMSAQALARASEYASSDAYGERALRALRHVASSRTGAAAR